MSRKWRDRRAFSGEHTLIISEDDSRGIGNFITPDSVKSIMDSVKQKLENPNKLTLKQFK